MAQQNTKASQSHLSISYLTRISSICSTDVGEELNMMNYKIM